MNNMREQTWKEDSYDRFEPVSKPPLDLENYRILRAQLKRTNRNLMGQDLANMKGYLNALEEYLKPVRKIIIYPVSVIMETAQRLRTWDATRYELAMRIDGFIVAIDREIKVLEKEV